MSVAKAKAMVNLAEEVRRQFACGLGEHDGSDEVLVEVIEGGVIVRVAELQATVKLAQGARMWHASGGRDGRSETPIEALDRLGEQLVKLGTAIKTRGASLIPDIQMRALRAASDEQDGGSMRQDAVSR